MLKTSHPLSRESRQAMDQAKRIADGDKQPFVDSLMILLALLRLRNSRTQYVLRSLNVKVENLTSRIIATIKLESKDGMSYSTEKVMTSEGESVLNAAFNEMQLSNRSAVDELDLLLGMLQHPESKAGYILSQYELTADNVREHVKVSRKMPATKNTSINTSGFLQKALRNGISPIFISLVVFSIAMAVFLWMEIGNNPRAFMIAFIMGGWIVSVALHEFGHAIVAFWGGDESVEEKGYLTLNPLKYSNPILSIILPVFFLLMGGIGFPGGAVYVNIYALRKPSYRSLVSVAGPLANLLFALLLTVPFNDIPFYLFFGFTPENFLKAIAFLAFLQITSIIINLLPIPGLDGFGILEPYLPGELVGFAQFIRPFGFMILYLFVFIDSPISDSFWSGVWTFTALLSPNLAYYANEGLKLFLNV
jgi:Zn-dependent protease